MPHELAVKPILSTTRPPLPLCDCRYRMGKECLAVRPVLVLSGRKLGGKILDVTLLPLLELCVGLQPFSRSQLHQCMHLEGPIYADGEE